MICHRVDITADYDVERAKPEGHCSHSLIFKSYRKSKKQEKMKSISGCYKHFSENLIIMLINIELNLTYIFQSNQNNASGWGIGH